jgi:hypothetical protein
MIKTLQSKLEYFIQFSEEEMEELNIKPDDVFDIKPHENGVLMTKRVPLELNLDEFDVITLQKLVAESIESGLSVNEIIVNAIETVMEDSNFYEKFNEE